MNIDFITKEDLEQFKRELFEELKRFAIYPQKSGEASKTWLKSFEVRKLLGGKKFLILSELIQNEI